MDSDGLTVADLLLRIVSSRHAAEADNTVPRYCRVRLKAGFAQLGLARQVALMTGRPNLFTPCKGMEDGADDFLVKLISLPALLSCMEARFVALLGSPGSVCYRPNILGSQIGIELQNLLK